MLTLRAAQLLRAAPDFPGRLNLLDWLRRRLRRIQRPLVSTFGPGLRVEINPSEAQIGPLLLRYCQPSLHRVFEAALRPGDVLADVGANQGVYTLLGASLVKETGSVFAFEPTPVVVAKLKRNVELNGFSNVHIVESAVGATTGRVTLHRVVDGASGLTSRYGVHGSRTEAFEAPVTTLDESFAASAPPALVKIDVEGMEFDVLRGARELMSLKEPPAIVFEFVRGRMDELGYGFRDVVALFEDARMSLFALTPAGLRPPGRQSVGADNVLGLRLGHARHAAILAELRNTAFPRYQDL